MSRLVPVQHRLIGTPAQVATVLRSAEARGHLIGMSAPEPYGRKVAVTVTLLQVPTKAIRAARWRPVLVGVVVAAALAGLGWLGLVAYRWACGHWAHLIALGVVLVLAMGAMRAARGSRR
jgi:hypothetical protein